MSRELFYENFYKREIQHKENQFFYYFKMLSEYVHCCAGEKGWWDKERNDGELIALMHSELSEALEALRNNTEKSDHIPEFSGIEEEFADVIIRIMDMSVARRYKIAEAIVAKIKFNDTRPAMHGGKKF